VPLRFERMAQHRAQRVFVFDEEDGENGGGRNHEEMAVSDW